MLKSRFALIGAVLLGLAASAFSQQFTVSTGDPKGTYAAQARDIGKFCGNELAFVAQPSSGAVENLERLVGNQVNGAFVQTDMIFRRAQTEDLGSYKTLIALHPEAAHFIVLANSGLKTGGKLGTSFGATDVVLTDLTQLAGFKVGAAGGSAESAAIIKANSDIPFLVEKFAKNDDALAALKAGTVQAVLMMGGAPVPSIAALPANTYKLLAISPSTVEKLKGAYKPARANYTNLGAAGVSTVSTDALLVVKNYKSAKMVESLSKLRACVYAKLDEITETTGSHPSWDKVKADSRGAWAYYELPAVAAPAGAKK